MQFIITLTYNKNHLDFQVANTIVEAVKICNDHLVADEFQINEAEGNTYLSGRKLENGHIDWVRNDLVGIERLK